VLRDGCTTSAAVLVLMVLSYCSPHRLPAPVAKVVRAQVPSFEHVFVVVEENENFSNVVGNTRDMPYLNHLAADYGLATNYYANTHPSINNYFILTAGRNGTRRPWIRSLSNLYPFDVEGENIASLLSEKGKTWKSYAEDLPLAGYVGRSSGYRHF
jgi:phosphatidylinositol-3-phosphatase